MRSNVSISVLIIPAGTDSEQRTRPVAGQKNAAINFVGIVDMQLSCESIDVVFDRARPNSDGHANVSIVEALGQKIWAGPARWPFANSRIPWPI